MSSRSIQTSHIVDVVTLCRLMSQQRYRRDMTWIEVCAEIGISYKSVERMRREGNSAGINASSLVSILAWLNMLGPLQRIVKTREQSDDPS